MTDRRQILYSVLNTMLGRRQEAQTALKQAMCRPANTVEDIDGNIQAVVNAHASLCGVLMTIRGIADELLSFDLERQIELKVLRDKFNTELTDMMRTEPTPEERACYRKRLGLSAAVGSR